MKFQKLNQEFLAYFYEHKFDKLMINKLLPKHLKFTKFHQNKLKKFKTYVGIKRYIFGGFGLKTLKSVCITPNQLEASRRVLVRLFRKKHLL